MSGKLGRACKPVPIRTAAQRDGAHPPPGLPCSDAIDALLDLAVERLVIEICATSEDKKGCP